jgi:hypothetical protein
MKAVNYDLDPPKWVRVICYIGLVVAFAVAVIVACLK